MYITKALFKAYHLTLQEQQTLLIFAVVSQYSNWIRPMLKHSKTFDSLELNTQANIFNFCDNIFHLEGL